MRTLLFAALLAAFAATTACAATGKAMAYRFSEALRSCAAIGVGGGRTLHAFAKELEPPDKVVTREIVAVIGNTKPNMAVEPFDIAAILATKLPVEFFNVWGPSAVATRQEADMLLNMPSIRTVLEKAENVDVAFVGIGDMHNSSFIRYGYVDGHELASVADSGMVGEVLGRFFDINGKPLEDDINDLHISIKLPAKSKLIGVASGAEKYTAIVGALRTGWLKGLITDETTAKAVVRSLSRDARKNKT